ncbi:MAG: hypothetical protein K9N06_02055 [Candidatus Cloacimonetes bacterium]|nr:hypothetical protein [Candidatus Cloacimonadota bacterium]
MESYFKLVKTISYNDEIPYVLKKEMISVYIYEYFRVHKNYEAVKTEYLDFMLKLIETYPHANISSYEHSSELDQSIMKKLVFEYSYQGTITGEDICDFSRKAIEIDKNHIVTITAYYGLVQYYLDMGEIEKAIETADAALLKFDYTLSWHCYKAQRHINSQPAILCFIYAINYFTEPEEILSLIDHFYEVSISHLAFQEFLKLLRAYVIEFTDSSIYTVIDAANEVDESVSSEYEFADLGGNYIHDYIFCRKSCFIQKLEDEKRERIIINGSVKARKYLFSEHSEILQLMADDEIFTVQKAPIGIRLRDDHEEFKGWQKAEINGDIFWIQIMHE